MLRDIEVHVVQVGHPSAANPDRAEGLITSMCGGLGANGPGDASATSRDSPALDDSVLTSGCLWLHRYTVTPIPDTECPLARLGKTRPHAQPRVRATLASYTDVRNYRPIGQQESRTTGSHRMGPSREITV